jgi:hypothetical protein
MPASVFSYIRKLINSEGTNGVKRNTVVLYEHRKFDRKGRKRIISVSDYSPQLVHSLHTMDFKDCMSSLKWNLEDGVSIVFTEDHDGGGRKYQIWGQGQDPDTHDNNFKDCASAWLWYRFGGEDPIP